MGTWENFQSLDFPMKHPFLLAILIVITHCLDFNEYDFFKSKCDASCIFNGNDLNSTTIGSFPSTCTTICTNLGINNHCDLSENQLILAFQNVKHLIGSLILFKTKFTSAKFLRTLESVECGLADFTIAYNPKMEEIGMTNLLKIKCSFINIHGNEEMKKLNIPNFKYASPSAENLEANECEIEINIDSEKYGFCITSVEMYNFINIDDVNLKKLGGGICEPGIQPSSGKLCNASYNVDEETEIQDGCTQMFGKLVINSKNVQNVQKLSSVEIIFGVLYIEKTNLTTIDFLQNLKYISALGYGYPAITVQNNPYLSNFSFPNLKRIKNNGESSVVFTNNTQEFILDPKYCSFFENELGQDGWERPSFDGKSCYTLIKEANTRPPYKFAKNLDLIIVVLLLSISQIV
ncbi:Protein CBG01133 [Caenorhabditis briggsae]|uniref:Protein CBG01133 n=1 Tax=Caenorhabditis briggsae TaxID=6238 RepID=A8WPM7_CAEBR|nr:Protein CBG01133 [Caenorhabditis briggsae]CAP22434.2 Protein CBG01133 [Caenorhabditis briggsae]